MSTAMLRQELQLLRREGLAPWALIALTLLLVAAATGLARRFKAPGASAGAARPGY